MDKKGRTIAERLDAIDEKISVLYRSEYTEMKENFRKILWYNFIIGIARGLGMAVGFTILGALVILLLQKLVLLHVPGISKFIAEIISHVQKAQ